MNSEGNPNSPNSPPVFDAGRWSTKPIGSPCGWTAPNSYGCSATPSGATPGATELASKTLAGLWPSSITNLVGAPLAANLDPRPDSERHIRDRRAANHLLSGIIHTGKGLSQTLDISIKTRRDIRTVHCPILNGGIR